jgi:hypothetical protein
VGSRGSFSLCVLYFGVVTNWCHRLLRDAEHLRTKFSKIDGAGDIGEHITTIVKEKTVAPPSEPPNAPEPPAARVSTEKQRPETETNEAKPEVTPAVT